MYVYVHIYVYTHVYVHIYVCLCVCKCVRALVCVWMWRAVSSVVRCYSFSFVEKANPVHKNRLLNLTKMRSAELNTHHILAVSTPRHVEENNPPEMWRTWVIYIHKTQHAIIMYTKNLLLHATHKTDTILCVLRYRVRNTLAEHYSSLYYGSSQSKYAE